MKKNNFIIITILTLCFLVGVDLKAQQPVSTPTSTTKVEKLKGLVALDPFKITEDQKKSFNVQEGQNIYFEDGSTLTFEELQKLGGGIEYIVVPYVNPADNTKIVAMLVRKSTPDESAAQKVILESMGVDYFPGGVDPNGLDLSRMSDMVAIKFDPNLKKDDFIKGLKEKPAKLKGAMQVNSGRCAYFDEKGNLIPLYLPDGKDNPLWKKYMDNPFFTAVFYTDSTGYIKAAAYRKSTLQERKNHGQSMSSNVALNDNLGGGNNSSSSASLGKPDDQVASKGENSNIGSKMDDFSAKDIKGNDVSISQYKGKKIVVLNFWFTRCKPCGEEMPALNKLVEEYKGKDVEFISICNDDATTIAEFLKKTEFKYRIVPNGLKLANQYKIGAFPTHIIIDKSSKVAFYEVGFSENISDKLKKAIDSKL